MKNDGVGAKNLVFCFCTMYISGSRIPEADKCSNCKGEKSEEVKKILEVRCKVVLFD